MKEKLKTDIPSLVITLILLLAETVLIVALFFTTLLSLKWILLIWALLLAATGGVWRLTKDFKRKVTTIIGCVLAVVLLFTQIAGCFYVIRGAAAINKVSSPQAELAEIGVFVRKDDPATDIKDIKGYSVGILSQLDRESSLLALNLLNSKVETTLSTTQYESITLLLDALLNKEIGAVLLNVAFFELLEDTDGYEEYTQNTRRLYSFMVERQKQNNLTNILPPKEDNTFILYITGIDTRSSKISRSSRSDVNILAAVNTETGQIALISTPRDYFVPLSISDGIPDKLTHSGVYGTQVSIDTMEMLYDINIDYYFKVNFTGFVDIIDALGGITVMSDVAFNASGIQFQKGPNQLSGIKALFFARERKSIGGDQHRGKHQLAVVRAVINKLVSPALLTNYAQVLEGIEGSFETNVPYEEIAKLVRNQLDKGTRWNIVSYSVTGQDATMKPYSLSQKAYVVIPDLTTVEKAKSLISQVQKGKVPSAN
jgi:LCP family protein required for cell wall assembly